MTSEPRKTIPDFEPTLPPKNDHPQLHYEGARDALRVALSRLHGDQLNATQMEFQSAVVMQSILHVLMAKGLVTSGELDQVHGQIYQALLGFRQGRYTGPMVTPDDVPERQVDLDCSAHHAICGAACCSTFDVFLTPEEARSNRYLWDLTVPYRLLHDHEGTCVYFDRDSLGCSIWQHRPKACRNFDCRTDGRVWHDYAQRTVSLETMERRAALAARRQAKAIAPPAGE
ncbi:MAG: YkgJ family cysteine cluster protein [Myxococcota bacterium]